MTDDRKPRIAVCFFGITRSLSYTIDSIEKNILAPARRQGKTRVFAHFFTRQEIDNPRSGEKGALPQDEHKLLKPDWLELEEPEQCIASYDFEELKAYGDAWDDDFRSLRNLVHQLHSINRATRAALEWKPDIVIFARPDLNYHDSLERYIQTNSTTPLVQLPNWQHWGNGYNDRFAVCLSIPAAEAWGTRIAFAPSFCSLNHRPLHSELLLRQVLETRNIRVRLISARASRMRSNAVQADESFRHYRLEKILRLPSGLKGKIKRQLFFRSKD